MGLAENIETVRRFYAAGPSDDDAARLEFAVADIVWHVPGANRVSGDYRGMIDVFSGIAAAMQPLDRWEVGLVDVMANRDLVVATVDIRAERNGHALASRGAHVFRLDERARIVEAWGFVAEQAALDRLFDRPPR